MRAFPSSFVPIDHSLYPVACPLVSASLAAGSDYVLIGDHEMPIRQYLAGFNIVGELQTKLVRSLSGGERNRVHLARALRHPCNLLMLDEPTNDLDVDTLRSLEEALEDFLGSALIVSHDRYFIDRVATHLLVFRGNGVVDWFEGASNASPAAIRMFCALSLAACLNVASCHAFLHPSPSTFHATPWLICRQLH